MGIVYKARELGLERVVALKMIVAGRHASPDELGRFVIECQAMARLLHPNIVALFHAGQHAGQPYFVMEYVEGSSLAARVAAGPSNPFEAALLVEAVARAIQYCHLRGVLHRDLKPRNVLVSIDGVPKVADFGLAKLAEMVDGLTEAGTAVGTPAYMAPEQACEGLGPIDARTDVYGLGAILYALLTGQPPILGRSNYAVLTAVPTTLPIHPRQIAPAVPPELEAVCLKCLEKNPADRYASADELAAVLHQLMLEPAVWGAGEPVHQPATPWQQALRGIKLGVPVGLCICVLIVLGYVLAGWVPHGGDRTAELPPPPVIEPVGPHQEPGTGGPHEALQPVPPPNPGPVEPSFTDAYGMSFLRIDDRPDAPPRKEGVRAVYLAQTELTQKQYETIYGSWYKLTEPVFEELQQGSVPPGVREKLRALRDRDIYSRSAFEQELARILTRDEVDQCQKVIADSARRKGYVSYFHPAGKGKQALPAGADTATWPMNLTWNQTAECCALLNRAALEDGSARNYRLPTVDEFKCVAGRTERPTLKNGVFAPDPFNARNLPEPALPDGPLGDRWYNLYGNVAEWVRDPAQPDQPLTLGGSYADTPESCATLEPQKYGPDDLRSTIGLRLVCELP
jgi:serine/threonine protein kinase/formylglycine-generating enzyme required for sulfatase activity